MNHTADRAVNNAAYNSMPQHFETIHYQDVNYTASHGPFSLQMKTPKPPQPLAGTVHAITTTTVTVITMTTTVSGVSSNDVLFAKGRVLGRVNTVSGANITLYTKIFESSNLVTGDTVYVGADGSIDTAANIHAMTGISSQGGATAMLTNFLAFAVVVVGHWLVD